MDEQHIALLKSLSELRSSVVSGRKNEDVLRIFFATKDILSRHLDAEESYLNKFGCEGVVEHQQLHNNYRDVFVTIEDYFLKEDKTTPIVLLDMLGSWFVNHINFVDKKYTNCFHNHNIF